MLRYGPEVIDALRRVWAVLDGPTGKRLAPVMGELVASLRRHGELTISDEVAEQLGSMSAATIDRRLAGDRAELSTRRGRTLTKPGSLLKTQIPMRTWADWDERIPGFVEVDQKLLTKTRIAAKVIKTYDTAKTPYQRLLDHPDALDEADAKLLAKRFDTTNPAQARRDVSDLQKTLLGMVAHKTTTRRAKQNAVYLSRAKLDESTNDPTRAS